MSRKGPSSARNQWAVGGYSPMPVPLEDLGPPPVEWFSHEPPPAAGAPASTLPGDVGMSSLAVSLEEFSDAGSRVSAVLNQVREDFEQALAQTVERRADALRQLLGVHRSRELTFVVPTIESMDPIHRTVIASEDVRAFSRMQSGLGVGGLESTVTVLLGADDVVSPDPRNLLLFCRDERNPMTKEFLERLSLGVEFVHIGTRSDGRAMWGLHRHGHDPLLSSSYALEAGLHAELTASGDHEWNGEFSCPALIVRAPNPFNPEGSVATLLAGVRAFGTWGSAEYLCDQAELLLSETSGRDFLAIIDVTADVSFRRCVGNDSPPRFSTVFERIVSTDVLELRLLDSVKTARGEE